MSKGIWLVLLVSACSAPRSEPPADEGRVARAQEKAPAPEMMPGFVYEGWIGEGRPVLTPRSTVSVELADRPGGPGSTPCTLNANQALDFERSVVRTDRPGRVSLDAPHRLGPETQWFGATSGLSREAQYGPSAAEPPESIGPEQTVEHLAFRAEGVCYYRADGEVFGTSCFHKETESAESSWWIRIACDGQEGWLRADGREDFELTRQF